LEFVLPVVENADLLVREVVEGGGDAVVVLAHLRQGSGGIFASEHGVGATGALKGFSSADVVDATHSLLVIEPLHLPCYPLLVTLMT